jgi:molybdopterin synthase sulfur carrier subunit
LLAGPASAPEASSVDMLVATTHFEYGHSRGLLASGDRGNLDDMARVVFTANLRRHVDCPETEADGATVREVLDAVFSKYDLLRGYVLDDQAALRRHMGVIVDGISLRDRRTLSDPVGPTSQIYVLQALSGG